METWSKLIFLLVVITACFHAKESEGVRSPSYFYVGSDNDERIQTGTPTSAFPFMAALVGVTELFGVIPVSYAGARCGGSLIDDQTILTAAHCFSDEDRDKNFQALFGMADVSTSSYYKSVFARSSYFLDFTYDDIKFHPQYSAGTSSVNDVALIRLKKPIDLGCTKLKPICLAEKDYSDDLFVIGWGLQDCEARSDVLRIAKGVYVDSSKCKDAWKNITEIADTQYCSTFVDANGEDAAIASGDSGGPLFTQKQGEDPVQVGIASLVAFHEPYTQDHPPWCAKKHVPQVFTRVSSFKEFIKSNSNATFC